MHWSDWIFGDGDLTPGQKTIHRIGILIIWLLAMYSLGRR